MKEQKHTHARTHTRAHTHAQRLTYPVPFCKMGKKINVGAGERQEAKARRAKRGRPHQKTIVLGNFR